MNEFLKSLTERVVIYDGGMGTCIQKCSPTLDDFWGKENCSEVLNLSRPDIIRQIHEDYFTAGADVVETNTFGGSRIVLAEFGLEDRVAEINQAAVKIAREVADGFSHAGRRRFVAGSMGPTTKLPSLRHIGWDAMLDAHVEQATALIEGGVDVLLVETCQDLLQAKIGVIACFDAMKKVGKMVPVQVQVTLQESGAMLLGTRISAALTTLEMFDVAAIGLNCSTGPAEMSEGVRYLSAHSPKAISILPNAGMPRSESGTIQYSLTPDELAEHHRRFIVEFGVNIVGGCCGTTPAHIQSVAETCAHLTPAKRVVKPGAAAASMYSAVFLDGDPKPLMVAADLNSDRSEKFRGLLKEGKRDAVLSLAKQAVNDGAQMLDVRCSGDDEPEALIKVLEKLVARVRVPIFIDSTNPVAVEEALKRIPGKAVIGPVALKDSTLLVLAKRYGAGVVASTAEAASLSLTAEAVNGCGIRLQDVVLAVTTSSIAEDRAAGRETLATIKELKASLPQATTMLAVSDISLGLGARARRVLNSVFLQEAVASGLDLALVSLGDVVALHEIAENEVALAHKLLEVDETDGDPLKAYKNALAGTPGQSEQRAAQGTARG